VASPAVVLYRRSSTSSGATRWPEEQSVLFKALCGHPIELTLDGDYLRLYLVFRRMAEAEGYTLIRKRIADQRWHVFAVTKAEFGLMERLAVIGF
jgi:hypothetical protein